MTDAQPEGVAAWLRGRWGIENRLHWRWDVVFDEDRNQPRTRNGLEIMAALRNLAISLIRLFLGPGVSIASTGRSLSRRPTRAISLLTHQPLLKPTLPTSCTGTQLQTCR
ncbi:transposase [Actinomyces sp. SKVG-SVH-4(1)]|uniref:transposase n=1 Tax=Actinomyces sp. SKVG-SVH-4(1) TaxID=3240382 RepID=UPI003AF289E5